MYITKYWRKKSLQNLKTGGIQYEIFTNNTNAIISTFQNNRRETKKYNQYDDIFLKYEKEFGISYFLMKSIALTENEKFDHKAIMKTAMEQ